MICFFVGLVIGVWFGVILMAVIIVGKNEIKNKTEDYWIKSGYDVDLSEAVRCSICNYSTFDYLESPYCPNCGSKMEGYYKKDY